MKVSIGYVALAVLIGSLSSFMLGNSIFVLTVLTYLTLFLAKKGFQHIEDVAFIKKIFLLSLILRIIIATILHYYSVLKGDSGFFLLDDRTYDLKSWYLAKNWVEGIFPNPFDANIIGSIHFGYYFIIAFYYVIAGHDVLGAKYLNCFFGSLTVVLIYKLAILLFDKKTAKWAATVYSWFPISLFWSSLLLKDTWLALLTLTCVYYIVKAKKTRNIKSLLLFIVILPLVFVTRFFAGIIILFTFLISLSFDFRKRVYNKLTFIMILFSVLYVNYKTKFSLTYGSVIEQGVNVSEFNTYLSAGLFTKLKYFFIGVVKTLLEPFAWVVPKEINIYIGLYPGMWVWYLYLLPLFIIGYIQLVRKKDKIFLTLPIILGILVYILIYGSSGVRQIVFILPLIITICGYAKNHLLVDNKLYLYFFIYYLILGSFIAIHSLSMLFLLILVPIYCLIFLFYYFVNRRSTLI